MIVLHEAPKYKEYKIMGNTQMFTEHLNFMDTIYSGNILDYVILLLTGLG